MASALRAEFVWWKPLLLILCAALPVAQGWVDAVHSILRDRLDVFSVMQTSPLMLVFPIVIVVMSCTRFSAEVGHRYLALTRTRIHPSDYLLAKVVSSALVGGVAAATLAALPVVAAFGIWPLLGDPSVDPGDFGMSPAETTADAVGRESLSELMRWGEGAYGTAFVLWLASHGACYASLGVVSLARVRSRFLALLLPFAVYLGQTVVTSLTMPDVHWGLMFSAFPFGLDQSTVATLVTGGSLATVTITCVARAVLAADRMERFR